MVTVGLLFFIQINNVAIIGVFNVCRILLEMCGKDIIDVCLDGARPFLLIGMMRLIFCTNSGSISTG